MSDENMDFHRGEINALRKVAKILAEYGENVPKDELLDHIWVYANSRYVEKEEIRNE